METEIRVASNLSNKVQKAIEQVLESDDPLTKPDFNATDYINSLFPTEQSLNSNNTIDDVILKMQEEIQIIDANIRDVVRGVSTSGNEGKQALDEAKKTIQQLFSQISDIKTRAEVTEDVVKSITSDIKQLDCAKKNLTSAITTLNHLHMLVGGVEKLKALTEKRQYGDISNPLQAITEVNEHFKQYNEIPQIKELSVTVADIHKQLAVQITEDFKMHFSMTPNNSTKMSISQLKNACMVISVLDIKVRRELIKWFINVQLQEYIQLFHENQDISWLDKIDKRYAWIKRHLLDFEDKYGTVFPENWEVSERIVVEFCNITKSELSKVMSRRRTEIDVKLLLFAINKTSQFEELLGKRFTGCTLSESVKETNKIDKCALLETTSDKEQSSDEKSQAGDEISSTSPFRNLIGECFKPYLDIYTESIDRNLNDLIEKFLQVAKQQSVIVSLESCAELFIFYKKSLVQCTQLSNGKTLFDLVLVFKKYLREYAVKVLENQIPKVTTPNPSISTGMSLLKQKDFQNLQTAANQVIHSFLKEGEVPRYSKDERIIVCKILTTAEYCLETVQQLEEKLKEKIEASYVENIDLAEEKDVFHRVISHCIQLLVQDIENLCESSLTVMTKIQWQNISNVGDQSPYVNSIISHFKQTIPIIRDNLSTSRKYYTQFCHKFISSFIPKFINNLYKCRPTNSEGVGNIMGCEQLLLDTHSLKTVLLELPTIESQVNRKAPASYSKTVIKGMTKAEMIIKIVMANVNPHALFIEQYLKMLPDNTLAEFHKICEMKGIKRADQALLIDLYKKMIPENSNNNGGQEMSAEVSNEQGDDKGRIKKLENLIKKRLPN